MAGSLDDLKSSYFWRGLLAEALGTMVLVLIGCGSCIGEQDWETFKPPTAVQISLAFGLSVATVVWCLAHQSGGHVNPAVTMAMLACRRISVARALLYVAAQCSGAMAGAAVLKGLTPESVRGNLGLTTVNPGLTREQAFGVEFLITMVLVLTVFASCDNHRTDLNGSAPLAIGFAVTLCHLFAIKYTGSSMNPARTFGPAVVTGIWHDHWVYWCGPLLGGVVGGLFYEFVFAGDASVAKLRRFVLSSYHDDQPVSKDSKYVELTKHRDDEKESLRVVEVEASV